MKAFHSNRLLGIYFLVYSNTLALEKLKKFTPVNPWDQIYFLEFRF